MFLSKYGTARHIYIPVVKRAVVDHAVGADWTPAAGDVKISKDGGAAANVTNLPTAIAMGNSALWDFSLTATEMEAAQIIVTVADSATKAVEDTAFIIETYGHASAQHAADLDDSAGLGLSRLDAAVSTRLASASYTAPLDAAGTRAAVGLSAANLDTQLTAIDDFLDTEIAAIKAKTDNLPTDPADASDIAALIDALPTAAETADAVWDEALAGHLTAGSTGEALNAAGAAGDPWTTVLPGAYGAGSAGKIIGDNINATISSRLASASYTAPLDAAGTRSALGLASANLDTQLSAIDDFLDTEIAAILAAVDTEIAAIKAKTDNLPASPAAVGSAMTLTSGERDSIADALLGRTDGIETSITPKQALRAILASASGILAGAATSTVTLKAPDGSTTRITATVDADGNRSAVSLNL